MLSGFSVIKKEKEIEGLRAELAVAQKEQSKVNEKVNKVLDVYGLGSGVMANDSISQIQRLHETIAQLRGEVDEVKAETTVWKQKMDRLALEKEVARAQLLVAESQLQGVKEKSSSQTKKIEELEARLATELAKAKFEVEKVKANVEEIVAVYRSDAEAAQAWEKEVDNVAQTRAYWLAEHIQCQYRRDTLEEIHARSFDLAAEIKNAKELETEAKTLLSSNNDFGCGEGYEDEEVVPEED